MNVSSPIGKVIAYKLQMERMIPKIKEMEAD